MKRILILVLFSATLFACNNSTKTTDSKEPAKASLRLSWIPSVSSAGEFLGMKEYSKANNLDLKIDIGGPGIDPVKLIASGTNTFGEAGADLVLIANDKGADLVIIGLVNYNSPGVWLAKKEKNINTVDDVKGKRIGEFAGSDMIYLYEVFLKKTNLVRNKDFKPVPIPFDFKNFMTQDECDLRPVFIYNEPSEMELNHMPYTLIEPKDFGIQFKGLCYFCKRSTIEKNPELVQSFINTMAEGWTTALANPQKAVQVLKENDPSIRENKELLALQRSGDYFKGYNNKLFYSDMDSWKVMISDLKSLGYLKNEPDLSKAIDFTFVDKYYSSLNK